MKSVRIHRPGPQREPSWRQELPEKVRFGSGGTECAGWHYPGTNGACVIMAGGGAVTKEPGTDLFAKRFHDAGFAVLAQAAGAELFFLRRHLLDHSRADRPGAVAADTALPGGGRA